MALSGIKAYILSKKLIEDTLDGIGAIKGEPCYIDSIVDNPDGTHIVTLGWTSKTGESKTQSFTLIDGKDGKDGRDGVNGLDGVDGRGIVSAYIDIRNHLMVSLTDSTKIDAGLITTVKGDKGDTGERGERGDDGFSPTANISEGTNRHTLNITDANGTISTVIYDGKDGEDGKDGRSFTIKAQYNTELELLEAHPTGNAGDAYFVGDNNNPDLYIWLEEDNIWFNSGKIAGIKGDRGDDGVSIASITQTTISHEDDGINIITVTLDDGTESTFQIKNGSRGSDGENMEPISSEELAAMWED